MGGDQVRGGAAVEGLDWLVGFIFGLPYSCASRYNCAVSHRRKGHGVERCLEETPMLDYSNASIQALVRERGWSELPEFERARAIYNFVRDEILFGYNVDDNIPASRVLADGFGQCNTKGALFMALLRLCGIPCRVHDFTIDKKLQEGAMTGVVYRRAPREICGW